MTCLPQLTDQFKTVNPMQQVPAVTIDDITLSQSVSFFLSSYFMLIILLLIIINNADNNND